jgi:hypothetical protein
MKHVLWPLLLMCGCKYISQPAGDPADPITFSLINKSNGVLYVGMNDGSAVDVSVTLQKKDGGAFFGRLACRPACEAGCSALPCTDTPSVRALFPGEALLVEWGGVRFDEGSQSCGGTESSCLTGALAVRGRYFATICFARAFQSSGATTRLPDGVIQGAELDGRECVAPVEFGYPSYDVRYEVELR